MSQIETIMWCIAYALGRNPRMAEIHRAKDELSAVKPEYVNKTIKSIKLLLPYMSDREINLFIRQFCTCLLSAAAYRISMKIQERGGHGYLCPWCRVPLDRDYQSYCDRCGQHLDWES